MHEKYVALILALFSIFPAVYLYHELKNQKHKRKYKHCRNRTLKIQPLSMKNKGNKNV